MWIFIFAFGSAYGQMSQNKKINYLRNYTAPDFKQRRFDIWVNASSAGQPKYENNRNYFTEAAQMGYSQYSNSSRYQGSLNTLLNSNFGISESDSNKVLSLNNYARFVSQNRFYLTGKWFLGVRAGSAIGHSYANSNNDVTYSALNIKVTPAVSMGFGRLEPIQYARNAMDIEKSLQKGGRLTGAYTFDELNSIADCIAEINNVRFYDFRLRRIEQFEALDQRLKDVGHISEFDMTYFAYLSDAYLYAQNFARFSGVVHELGVVQDVYLIETSTNDFSSQFYSTALFYDMSYHLPMSYAVQHNFQFTAAGGPSIFKYSYAADIASVDAWMISGYELGLYPTTRTNFNFGARAGFNLQENSFEYKSQLYGNASVYLSPQFRLFGELIYSPQDYLGRHPFQNVLPIMRDISPEFKLTGRLTLSYAIF